MLARGGMIVGFGLAVLLLLAALWGWQNADELVLRWRLSGESAVWGTRCAAVGVGAVAQVVLLTVIGRCVQAAKPAARSRWR